MFHDNRLVMRDGMLIGALERMCVTLEIAPSQAELAKERYEGVGGWLADAEDPLLKAMGIFLQGSTAIGTTVKPIGSNEHDVDLVAHAPYLGNWVEPAALKKAIGDRLKANGHYKPLLVEMARCWRLVYANEFHMDITPSIPNRNCHMGGELVPDRALKIWKPSNPKGYKALFLERVKLAPRFRVTKSLHTQDRARADIEAFPEQVHFKGLLQRVVQILKRHRDVFIALNEIDISLSPISVLVTTLASQSYEYCVRTFTYESELDLLFDVIRHMTDFIETRRVDGQMQWFVWNETTKGENFSEKWNGDPKRAEIFFTWHTRALADISRLKDVDGLDGLRRQLGDAFGSAPAKAVIDSITDDISTSRQKGTLGVAPRIGLVTGITTAAVTPVRANTFFGR
ncbi:nucleotidyltransferase [Rhizobium laguerreae]|uniref:nucleotidyltransferase domain-containing protein n=1 Tax=Rhizobium laguerreae TaxID=1076926 RepID=UPI0014790D3D|nr:nucleotidyltransferase [Rhizobium laguerreae]NNG71910.1 nucleotidyltransferase [Rhizobium laguerreae]